MVNETLNTQSGVCKKTRHVVLTLKELKVNTTSENSRWDNGTRTKIQMKQKFWTGQDRTGQNRTDRTGQDRTDETKIFVSFGKELWEEAWRNGPTKQPTFDSC